MSAMLLASILLNERCFRAWRPDDFPSQFRKLARLAVCQTWMICAELKGNRNDYGNSEVLQRHQRLWLFEQGNGQPDVFVHISAVERAGTRSLTEGQKVSFDIVKDARKGKSSAENIQAA